ncbi:MAG: FtsX-like permease family protein [Eubacteriales bacterium]
MNNIEIIKMSFRNLLRRRTRSILSIIGVVVGTSSIVVMLSLGFGLSANYQQQVESYGNLHIIDVMPNGGGGGGGVMMGNSVDGKPGQGGSGTSALNDLAVASIDAIKGVDASTPVLQEYMKFALGKFIASSNVMGMKPEFMEKLNFQLQDGRFINSSDKFAIVFGNQIPMSFYNPKKTLYSSYGGAPQVDVITDKILMTGDMAYGEKYQDPNAEKINYKMYKVKGVGLLANPNDESAYNTYMNIDTVKIIKADLKKARRESTVGAATQGYDLVKVYVGNIKNIQSISDQIRAMGFQTSSLNDWLKSMQDTARMIQGILGGIGAISLLVAAIGITNTMIMSIYERTREIGVMKVIGANLIDIRNIFLLEAGLIGFLGGIAGIIFSFLISLLMNTLLKTIMGQLLGSMGGGTGGAISIIPWWLVFSSLIFSTAIGVIAGYYPARRAMRMSALESLRNE